MLISPEDRSHRDTCARASHATQASEGPTSRGLQFIERRARLMAQRRARKLPPQARELGPIRGTRISGARLESITREATGPSRLIDSLPAQ